MRFETEFLRVFMALQIEMRNKFAVDGEGVVRVSRKRICLFLTRVPFS